MYFLLGIEYIHLLLLDSGEFINSTRQHQNQQTNLPSIKLFTNFFKNWSLLPRTLNQYNHRTDGQDLAPRWNGNIKCCKDIQCLYHVYIWFSKCSQPGNPFHMHHPAFTMSTFPKDAANSNGVVPVSSARLTSPPKSLSISSKKTACRSANQAGWKKRWWEIWWSKENIWKLRQ